MEDGKYYGCEVKYRENIVKRKMIQGIPIKKGIILSKEDFEFRENRMIVPMDVFLALLPVSERNL